MYRERFLLALVFLSSAFLCGCAAVYDTKTVTVKPVVHNYQLVALVGLEPEDEQIFRAEYLEAFPNVSFIEEKKLSEVIEKQALLDLQLDDRNRTRINNDLGVQAIIYAHLTGHGSPGIVVRIVDTVTGKITGSVMIDSSGGSREVCIQKAVSEMKSYLIK